MDIHNNYKSRQLKLEIRADDGKDTNFSKDSKLVLFLWLIQRKYGWLTLRVFAFTGFVGYFIVSLSFIPAHYIHSAWLLLSILGIVINWLSVSLNKHYIDYNIEPEKLRQLVSTFILDWTGIFLCTIGFMIYVSSPAFIFGILLLILFTLRVLIILLRYKINKKYIPDWELINFEQQRLLLGSMIIAEFLIPWSIVYSVIFICALLFVINLISITKLLVKAD